MRKYVNCTHYTGRDYYSPKFHNFYLSRQYDADE